MKTNLELVDLLRSRANVSYEDAKAALEACDNDIVEALIHLEKKDKIRKNRQERAKQHESNFKAFLKEVMDIKFIIKKKGNIVLNLPLVIAALFALCTLPLFLIFVGIAIITGHKFQIKRGSELVKVKKVFDDIKENINNMTTDEDEVEEQAPVEEEATDTVEDNKENE